MGALDGLWLVRAFDPASSSKARRDSRLSPYGLDNTTDRSTSWRTREFRITLSALRQFPITPSSVLRAHRSALRHGCSIEDISHAVDAELYESVLDEDHDPPKLLIIGPDSAGNILELLGGELADDGLPTWHADHCRRAYLDLLPKTGGEA